MSHGIFVPSFKGIWYRRESSRHACQSWLVLHGCSATLLSLHLVPLPFVLVLCFCVLRQRDFCSMQVGEIEKEATCYTSPWTFNRCIQELWGEKLMSKLARLSVIISIFNLKGARSRNLECNYEHHMVLFLGPKNKTT